MGIVDEAMYFPPYAWNTKLESDDHQWCKDDHNHHMDPHHHSMLNTTYIVQSSLPRHHNNRIPSEASLSRLNTLKISLIPRYLIKIYFIFFG